MARKRLNTNFVVPTVGVALLLGTGVLIWLKNAKPRNPGPYIAAGDASMQRKDFAKAIPNYSAAVDLMPEDWLLHLKLGRAYYMNRGQGMDANVDGAVQQFTKAEELKPDSKDAWEGLLQSNEVRVEYFESRPGDLRNLDALPQSISMAREAAGHLAQLEPNNIVAQEAGPILVLRVWIQNLTMPETTYEHDHPDQVKSLDEKAAQAITDLSKLMVANPEDEKLPYWVARAKIFQAQQALKGDHPEAAAPLFAEAASAFDGPIGASPKTVGLYINKAAILQLIQGVDPDAHNWQNYRKRLVDALDQAQQLVDPKDVRQYELAKEQWARAISGTDPMKAELVYRDLIARFPQDLSLRLELASLLQRQPSRRNDGIAVLDEAGRLQPPPVTDIQAHSQWDRLVAACKLQRADIDVDQLTDSPPGKAHDDLVADINRSLDAARKTFDGDFRLLRVQGRFQLINGQTRDAIVTLTAAADKMTTESGKPDYQLLVTEAEAYRRGSQTGKAIELLQAAVADPNGASNPELHFKLAELNIHDRDFARAKPDVDWMAVRYPDNPQTIELQIRALGPTADWKSIEPLYNKLHEKTPDEMSLKYEIASQNNNRDESIRLLYLLHKANPQDTSATSNLVQLLRSANRNDEAKTVVADMLRNHPDDPTVKVLQKLVDNASRTEVEGDELAVINAIPDAFNREGKLAQFYQLKENPEEELRHLLVQAKLQPNDKGVLETIFIRHLDAQRFSDAAAMIPHLSELDADQAGGLMYKVKVALAKQDVPNALIFGQQMLHDYPQFAQSSELYGEALAAAGKFDEACSQFQNATGLQATNIDAWRNLIRYTVLQNKMDEAKSLIAKACRQFPGDPQYRDLRVKYEILYGDPESVLPELTALVEQHPDDQKSYALLAQAQMASMRAKSQLGQGEAASQYLEQAKETYHKATTHWPDDVGFANDLSQMYLDNNDFTSAEGALKALAARPHWKNQQAPLILLGRVYLKANKPQEAEDTLKQAIEYDPHSVDGHLELANALIQQKKYDDALAVLQPGTSDIRIRSRYTDLLLGMNRGSQAEVSLGEAIKASPTNEALANMLLRVYDAEGSFDQGIRAASRDIETDPRNIFAYLWRGKMEAVGPNADLDAALKDLSVFRDAAPTNLDGRIALAQVYDLKLDRDLAIHELESAVSFDPQNRNVRFMLLQQYLMATPPRNIDADRLLTQTLAIPAFQHDPDFESKAALLWARRGEDDRAVTTIQDAITHSSDKTGYLHDYFDVLLTTGTRNPKNLQLLLNESDRYASDPKTSWFIFNDRGLARAELKDDEGAMQEFATAMDRSIAVPGRDSSELVANSIATKYGIDKTLDVILPRAQNSVTWKLIAVNLYIRKGDFSKGIALAEAALSSVDSLTPADQLALYQSGCDLYLNVNPMMLDKATQMCQKILAVKPDDLDALDNLASIMSDLRSPPNLKEALTYSQHAYDLSLKSGHLNPRIADTQAWILIQSNELDKGIDVMMRSIDQADFPEAHYHLARAYLMKNPPMAEEAQGELSRATEILQKLIADGHPVDATLKDKIDIALKKIDDIIHDKSTAKAAM